MKKLLMMITLLMGLVACKKQNNPSPDKVGTPPTVTTTGMNSVELGLVGNWVMDKRTDVGVGYDSFGNPDTVRSYTYFNNPAMNTLSLISQADTNRAGPYIVSGYKCTTSVGMAFATGSPWRAVCDSVKFMVPFSPPSNFTLYFLRKCTVTELELEYRLNANSYTTYHFQK